MKNKQTKGRGTCLRSYTLKKKKKKKERDKQTRKKESKLDKNRQKEPSCSRVQVGSLMSTPNIGINNALGS
jgi:hypothetical protein